MSGTDRHHDHDAHAEIGSGARPGYYDMMETAIRELLVEKKLIGADEIRRQIEVLDSRTPALGAKVVARAWVNPDFRRRLLAHGRAACEQEFGIAFYDDTELIVLENTEKVHNLIVCTLCSCYRDRCWDCRRIGTNLSLTAPAPCPSRARSSPSLEPFCRTTSRSW
jgi:hypothetical protein